MLFISTLIWKKHLFDKVIDPIIDYVKKLVEKVNDIKDEYDEPKPLSYLCIAGGLAANKYFQYKIIEAFGKRSEYKLSIRIPREPSLAVINGALMTMINEVCYILYTLILPQLNMHKFCLYVDI